MSLHLPCSSLVMDCSVHITSHVFTASRTLANQNMEIAFSFFQLLNIHLQYIYIQECDFYIILMVLIGTPMFAASQPNPAKRYVLKENGVYYRYQATLNTILSHILLTLN